MRRLIARLLSVVLLLLALVLAAVGVLLGTEAGTSWLVGLVQSLAPGMIRVERSEGDCFGHLELHGVALSLETMTVNIDRHGARLGAGPPVRRSVYRQ